MRKNWKKRVAIALVMSAMTCTPVFAGQMECYAKESIGNGVIISDELLEMSEGGYTTFSATLPVGMDASRLYCVSANPELVSITPVSINGNVATFMLQANGNGKTVVAVSHYDNPAVVAYMTVNTTPIIMEIPKNLGTSKDNYCVLESYEFIPYNSTYMDFNDYKYDLKLNYKCASYKDSSYKKWGCYAYFYDANGKVVAKKHIYCASLAEGRTYQTEFHVPANAVKFRIEGTGDNIR